MSEQVERPTAGNHWHVFRPHLSYRAQGWQEIAAARKVAHALDPYKYRKMKLERYVRESAFGEAHNVSLPALRFLEGERK